ncbi:hypothetical protein GCM10007867_05300 [Gluconobacter cerinus]|uniref:Uncharacterized protein n=1 Tax=Gluconobacter cerinus TaxID=38307 RepID=A0AAV5NC74_9PROT|nr:hypothetical protein GCM10007867_05300 [Gluconobacter cerinus]
MPDQKAPSHIMLLSTYIEFFGLGPRFNLMCGDTPTGWCLRFWMGYHFMMRKNFCWGPGKRVPINNGETTGHHDAGGKKPPSEEAMGGL